VAVGPLECAGPRYRGRLCWDRNALQLGEVSGVSLLAACQLRFRSGRPRARERAELTLEAGSAYVLSGPVWTQWQHHIPAVTKERWSMTFRTLRPAAAGIR